MAKKILNPCKVCGVTPIPKEKENGVTVIECPKHCTIVEDSYDGAIRMWNILNEKSYEEPLDD